MVNLLKNNSVQGLYFTEEENGQIANNTPGEIDLDNLTLATMYIYFDTIIRFQHKVTYNREGDDWIGLKTWASGQGTVQASTGGAKRGVFLITVEADETTAENLERMGILNVKTGSVSGTGKLKYLVKQTAASAFRQFPNSAGALVNYTAIIIRGSDSTEIADKGKDVLLINIACEEITARPL